MTSPVWLAVNSYCISKKVVNLLWGLNTTILLLFHISKNDPVTVCHLRCEVTNHHIFTSSYTLVSCFLSRFIEVKVYFLPKIKIPNLHNDLSLCQIRLMGNWTFTWLKRCGMSAMPVATPLSNVHTRLHIISSSFGILGYFKYSIIFWTCYWFVECVGHKYSWFSSFLSRCSV